MNINIFRSLKVLIASKDLFDNWLQAGINIFYGNMVCQKVIYSLSVKIMLLL
jgi:hypothetical protein